MPQDPPISNSDRDDVGGCDGSADAYAPMTADVVIPATRMSPPRLSRTTITRANLVQTVRRRRDVRIVRFCAPSGWGKTTVLTQWRAAELADADGRETCWLTVDGSDQTVERFLAALVETCAAGVADFALRWRDLAPAGDVEPVAAVIPVVVDELAITADRALIVLDDLHLATAAIEKAVGYLIQLLPANVQLAYSTTERLPLHLAPLSMLGDVAEIGVDHLRLDAAEAQQIAGLGGVGLGGNVAEALIARTEGWPAGVASAVQVLGASARTGPMTDAMASDVIEGLSGQDRFLATLFDEQVLRRLDEADLKMLLCASLLEHVNGSLVDALTGATDSSARLRRLAAPGGFVITTDRRGESYRLHPLFREALRGMLEETTPPEQVREMHRRACVHLRGPREHSAAIAHAAQAERPDLGADALAAQLPQLIGEPDLTALRDSVDALGAGSLNTIVPLELCAALLHGLSGAVTLAGSSLRAAERTGWSGPVPGGWASVDDAIAIIDGSFLDFGEPTERILDAARRATVGSPWITLAQYAAGRRSYLAGDRATARGWFELATLAVERSSADSTSGERLIAALSWSYLAIIATDDRQTIDAGAALSSVSTLLDDPHWYERPVVAPLHLAVGVVEIAADRPADAERALAIARDLAPRSSSTKFHALIELTRAAELRGDLEDARRHLAAAEVIAPGLLGCELLLHRFVALDRLLHPARLSQAALVSPITDGEMAVLRRAPTEQTQVEIAKALHISINTVKSHLRSIYQKLGVSSRPAAVRRAQALGLLLDDRPTAADQPSEPISRGGSSPG